MGCDIHLFAEKKQFSYNKESFVWVTAETWIADTDSTMSPEDINLEPTEKFYSLGRNYNLFCALANVRSYQFKSEPKCISSPKGLPEDCCKMIKIQSDDYGSDGHNHTWLTTKELQEFDWTEYGDTCDKFKEEVLPKMQDADSNPENVRIVFFFDN